MITGVYIMSKVYILLLALVAIFTPKLSNAGESNYLTLGAGIYEIGDDYSSGEYRAEYRHSNIWKQLYPIAGINANTDGGIYGFGGLAYDFYLGDSFVIIPAFAVGAYEEGDSKDLGGTLEFRSQLEFAYQFKNMSRLGISYSHMSNASLYEHNPGQESLVLNYSIPLSK